MKRNFSIWISSASLALSVGSICVAAFNREPYELDILSWFVGFSSFIVSIFVMVQIYHSFTLKRDIDAQNKALIKDIEERYIKQSNKLELQTGILIEDYGHTVESSIAYINAFHLITTRGYSETAFHLLIKSIAENNKSTQFTNSIKGVIECLKKYRDKDIKFSFPNDKVENYIMALALSKDKEAINLIPYIQSFSSED